MQWLIDIINNNCFVCLAMAVIIFLVTQLLKLPIKLGTKHIKNERVRKIVNSVILLIPFGLGVLLNFLWTTYYLGDVYEMNSIIVGLGYGTAGISLYGIVERFFKVKVNNPYNTEEGKAVTDLINDITADGKVDSTDQSAVQDFIDKMNNM